MIGRLCAENSNAERSKLFVGKQVAGRTSRATTTLKSRHPPVCEAQRVGAGALEQRALEVTLSSVPRERDTGRKSRAHRKRRAARS